MTAADPASGTPAPRGIRWWEHGRNRRLVGLALVAYGAAGLLLTLSGALFASGALGSGMPGSFAEDRQTLAGSLDSVGRTLADAEVAAGRVDDSLGSTGSAAREAATMTADLAASLRRLATAMELQVLGTRPFAGLGADFTRVADRADALATELDTTAASLDNNRVDARRIAADFSALRDDVGRLRTIVESAGTVQGGPDALAVARALLVAVLGWLAIPAAISLWAGIRLLRPGARRRHPAPSDRARAV